MSVEGGSSSPGYQTSQPVSISGTVPVSGAVSTTQGTSPWVTEISSWFGASPTIGQKGSAFSIPVVLASDQSTLPITGSVSVINFPGTQAVTGTFWQATQPISGSVSVSNFPATQPVSGTFWQATQPVSGPVTDAQLRASAVPVSGTFYQATQPVSVASLPLPSGAAQEHVTAGGYHSVRITDGSSFLDPRDVSDRAARLLGHVTVDNASLAVTGTFFQGTQPVSGTFWPTVAASPASHRLSDGSSFYDATKTGQLPTALVSGRLDVNIGASSATVPVSGTFWPTTAASPGSQRLSDGSAFYDAVKTGQLPSALVGSRLDSNVGAWLGSTAPTVGSKASASSVPVVIASDQGAVAVSGTVTANQGTANTAANGWFVRITDATNNATIKAATGSLSTDNGIVVQESPNMLPTYHASTGPFAAAATPTDIFCIVGSGTKTIRVQRIWVYCTQTTAGGVRMDLVKRSADNTGGTSATPTKVPHDSNAAAATAVVRSYTANPTGLGTLVGIMDSTKSLVPGTASLITELCQVWDFSQFQRQAIVLRGVAQILAINLNSVTVTGNSFSITVEWTEE